MEIIDIAVNWLHLLGAFTWVGGLIFVNLVLSPVVTPKGIPPQFVRLMGMERFRVFAWTSIGVLIATGGYNTWRAVPSAAVLLSTAYGITLLIKISIVAVMVLLTHINSNVLRRKIMKAPPGPQGANPEMQAAGGYLTALSRLNLGLGLLVLLLVAALQKLPAY